MNKYFLGADFRRISVSEYLGRKSNLADERFHLWSIKLDPSFSLHQCGRNLEETDLENYGISPTAGGGGLELKLHEVPTTDSSQVRRVQVQVQQGEGELDLNMDEAYLS